ncbi:hypothetical protein ACFVIM_02495 [Streptomyces sp. NPDC057638]|uniref:hypothetical protein n=1 Tax=Streptomyces sp. NPDC057638 TaxID=3346190 RepID=UPI0036D099C0
MNGKPPSRPGGGDGGGEAAAPVSAPAREATPPRTASQRVDQWIYIPAQLHEWTFTSGNRRRERSLPTERGTVEPPIHGRPLTQDTSGLLLAPLHCLVRLLPPPERADWVGEQRGYLRDLPDSRARWKWVLATLVGMPRYAYTVRTGSAKETV